MTIDQIKSAVFNLVMDGLQGAAINSSILIEQVEDEVVNEKLKIIEEINMTGRLNQSDLYLPLRGLSVTCSNIERFCNSNSENNIKKVEVPQIITAIPRPVDYFGTTDMMLNYRIYTDVNCFVDNKYRRARNDKPYVWIDTTPNSNNMNDAFIFNAPFVQQITMIGAFKDVRQVELLGCCTTEEISNMSSIDSEVIRRLTAKYIDSHRKLAMAPRPNNQQII